MLRRPFWFYLGPAFLVSVGYMDPGNWATSLEAGSRYGYALLWVITLASAIAILMQLLAARLGVVTGQDLAQLIATRYKGWRARGLLSTAVLAMMATDLAEFLGVAVALNLLLDIPLVLAIFLTVFDVLLILWLERFGFRWVEMTIIAFVATIGLGYVVELWIVQPDWTDVAVNWFVPNAQVFDNTALFIALGIIGATVMPHNIFLHSSQVLTRMSDEGDHDRRRILKLMRWDTVGALTAAWLVNSAILITAAAAFHEKGLLITDIDQAYVTLGPLFGEAAALTFGFALLASGIASSTTATMAGQIVFEPFLGRKVNVAKVRLWLRLATMIPAVIAILLTAKPLSLLVLSQVILSMQLPFTLVPLILFVSSRSLMGEFRPPQWQLNLAWACALLIIALNLWFLGAA
ncbi:manganese transport protein [Sulfurivirga caldicuralii]|uniref:Manganese transport protein n=1 Tax=Sulfurivirga caldicuralii TaxID=364032 RepID=A0A1N6GW27_9GAMM|nr:Nramp family divalent metal transporter [Sulfurivirga caldicuralii]SIO11728.1 manganese transport protein [Sulfurivirga caldicuralii]